LSPAMEPRPDAARISQVFGIQRSADGFFLEAHAKLEPLKTATDGVFIAGACQGPKDIPYSVAQGAGAAAEVLRLLSAGRVTISPVVAQVADEICSGCRACLPICPYHALTYDEAFKVARINEALCKGCGTCVAACPSGALSVSHFRTPQVLAQIEEVLAV
ncbi:MAG: 4Fe-4S binding protein, partial [Bacillota bacterium]|nr:4Fe-4S binding protein [Bacillota bacterium]